MCLVGWEMCTSARAEACQVDLQRIGLAQLQPALGRRLQAAEGGDGPLVDLDSDDMAGAFEEQRPGEAAGAGADLDHQPLVERGGAASDAACEIEIEQEMLAQALAGIETVGGNDFAQRRQPVDPVHGAGRCVAQRWRRRAMSSAIRRLAIRLVGSARPVPTMSRAVPWSGEVRTKGNPRVTLTPPAKSTVLIGISAWS